MTNYVMEVDAVKLKNRLTEQMEENDIKTQKELAIKTKLPQSLISYLLSGNRTAFMYKTVDALGQYFNVNTEWLAGRYNARKPRKINEQQEELPKINLFRQIADAETPEKPKPAKYSGRDLIQVLQSIDKSLKAIKEKMEA